MKERCNKLDPENCRCLRPPHDEKTPCDFPYTPWAEALSVSYSRARRASFELQPLYGDKR